MIHIEILLFLQPTTLLNCLVPRVSAPFRETIYCANIRLGVRHTKP